MINPKTIRTISDLRENPLEIMQAAQKLGEPIYLFYRSRPKSVVLDLEKFNELVSLIEDYNDALIIKEAVEDKEIRFAPLDNFWKVNKLAR